MKILAGVVAFLVALGALAITLQPAQAAPWQAGVRAVTVKLVQGSSNCSAVVIAEGVLLTAKHCKEGMTGAGPVLIEGRDVSTDPAEWVAIPDRDVAKIYAPGIHCPCAVLADTVPETPDTEVAVVGFPFGIAKVLTMGLLQSVLMWEGEPVILVTAAALPGNSGGGLFLIVDGKAILIGILSKAAGHLSLAAVVTKATVK